MKNKNRLLALSLCATCVAGLSEAQTTAAAGYTETR